MNLVSSKKFPLAASQHNIMKNLKLILAITAMIATPVINVAALQRHMTSTPYHPSTDSQNTFLANLIVVTGIATSERSCVKRIFWINDDQHN